MARPPDYLRDRGLADDAVSQSPVLPPWGVDLKTGAVVAGEGSVTLASVEMPNDYDARCRVLDAVKPFLYANPLETTMEMAHRLLAFLTGTEKVADTERERTFTDE